VVYNNNNTSRTLRVHFVLRRRSRSVAFSQLGYRLRRSSRSTAVDVHHYSQSSTTPAGLPLLVSTYTTSGPAATVPHLPATSTCMYNRDVYGYLSSMFVDNTVTVPPSSMTATTSGMTSYLSCQYAVGAPAFTIQPTPPVPAATVPMPLCATVTPCPPTQNFVASGADAVQGPTFPVPVAVAGTLSTTAVACGSASTDVRSTVDGASLPTSTAGVVGQSSTTSTSSGSGSGSPSGTSPPPPPVSNGSSTSPLSSGTTVPPPSATSTSSTSPPVVVVRQFQRVLPYSGKTSWKLFRDISAVPLKSTHGRHLKNRYNT